MNEKEIQTLLASMTIEEKVAQMVQVPYTWVGKEKAEYYASILFLKSGISCMKLYEKNL